MTVSDPATSLLSAWQNFYVIIGSSAGALTGLQFVVIALIKETEAGGMTEIRAFGTPTVVHFCAALLIAAIASAPWHRLSSISLGLGACGLAGLVYGIQVIRHARRQTSYEPDAGDWLWYSGLPLLAYTTLLIAAVEFAKHPQSALFVIAAAALLLLFIGIHNAWDSVTYIAVARRHHPRGPRSQS